MKLSLFTLLALTAHPSAFAVELPRGSFACEGTMKIRVGEKTTTQNLTFEEDYSTLDDALYAGVGDYVAEAHLYPGNLSKGLLVVEISRLPSTKTGEGPSFTSRFIRLEGATKGDPVNELNLFVELKSGESDFMIMNCYKK